MSKKQEEILRILKELGKGTVTHTEPAVVKSVDEPKCSCVVTIDDYDIEDIRLNAVIDDKEGTSFIIPVVGSWVLVSYIMGSETDAFISAFSEVEKIITKANSLDVDITEIILKNLESLTINNGDNAGLVKVIGLTEKLNNIESDINSLKQALGSWVPVPQDGGAALKSGISSWAAQQLIQTQQTDIENDIIKH